jgi:hypothetical protein
MDGARADQEFGGLRETCKNIPNDIAHAIFYWHNRGLRFAKGVGICPN